MIGRLHHLVLDAADPQGSAEFWSVVLGQPITYDDGEFVVVAPDATTSGIAFQLAPDHISPTWPDAQVPQQMHLDVMVSDIEGAAAQVLALGARFLEGDTFSDPAGHPFCLIRQPAWADTTDAPPTSHSNADAEFGAMLDGAPSTISLHHDSDPVS